MPRNPNVDHGLLLKMIDERAEKGHSLSTMARACNCSPSHVSRVIKDLNRRNRMPKVATIEDLIRRSQAARRALDRAKSKEELSDADAQAVAQEVAEAAVLSPTEQMWIYSIMSVDEEVQPNVRVAAGRFLNELRQQHAPADTAGPPPPTTPQERIARLARILQCYTPEQLAEAKEQVWPSSPSDSSAGSSSPSSSSPPETTADAP